MNKTSTSPHAAPLAPPPSGVIGTPFAIYSVPLVVGSATTAEKCQTAADILLSAAESLQQSAALELGNEDTDLTPKELSAIVDAARVLTIVARGMLDARYTIEWEAAHGKGGGHD